MPANAIPKITVQDQVDGKSLGVCSGGFYQAVYIVLGQISETTAFLTNGNGSQDYGVGPKTLAGA